MKRTYKFIVGVLGIASVIVLWKVFDWSLTTISGASDSVKGAAIAAIGSVIVFFLGRYFEQRREAKQRISVEKIDIYKRFYDFYFNTMHHQKIYGKPIDGNKILKDMLEFHKDVVFWGSDEVIRAYLDYKDCLNSFSAESPNESGNLAERLAKVMKAVAKVLVAMRRDVGYNFTTISANELARMQLADDVDSRRVFDHL